MPSDNQNKKGRCCFIFCLVVLFFILGIITGAILFDIDPINQSFGISSAHQTYLNMIKGLVAGGTSDTTTPSVLPIVVPTNSTGN